MTGAVERQCELAHIWGLEKPDDDNGGWKRVRNMIKKYLCEHTVDVERSKIEKYFEITKTDARKPTTLVVG